MARTGSPAARDRHAPPYTPAGWRALPVVARRLMEIRFLRSIGQGALSVDFVLYLKALHWSPAAIGVLFAATSLIGAALMLPVGPLSDHWGRRPFLLWYAALAAAGSTLLMFTSQFWVLTSCTVLLGFGRGGGGAAGPFSPAEQAWLAQQLRRDDSGRVFSLNGAITFWGMGIGAALGGTVPLWSRWLVGAAAYRPLFGLNLLMTLLTFVQLVTLREERSAARHEESRGSVGAAREQETRRQENHSLLLLAVTNGVNSFAIGLFTPLLPYWFSLRFGVGPAALGPVFGATYLLTGLSSVATGELVQRIGLVAGIVWVRLLGVLLLAAMPWMPTFFWAATLYVVRSVLNRGSAGARQAFGVGLVRDERRGLASSINGVSFRLPAAAGPALSGWMLALGDLDLPLYLSAGLQLAYAVLFGALFGRKTGGRTDHRQGANATIQQELAGTGE